jgi:prepilin-type N-terminal cleavage/methylation domain-containing protein
LAKRRTKNPGGFTLVEVIIGSAILAVLALFLFAAAYPARMAINQADSETVASHMAFAVLEAIRAEAPDLDLDGTVALDDLDLSNPNNLKVAVDAEQDSMLPDLYLVTVRVEEPGGKGKPVIMRTLIRGCSR